MTKMRRGSPGPYVSSAFQTHLQIGAMPRVIKPDMHDIRHDAFFFFGMAELSNIPLTWIDLTRQMPSLRESYKQVHAFFQLFFVIVFLLIRCVIWPVRVLFVMYRISLFVNRGLIHSVPVAYGFMGTTMLLTALQLVWGRKILFLAIRSYGGDDKAKTK